MISELITFRITKAKAKVKFGWSIYVDINAKDHLSNSYQYESESEEIFSGNSFHFNFRFNGN